jgi:hypothetical protein
VSSRTNTFGRQREVGARERDLARGRLERAGEARGALGAPGERTPKGFATTERFGARKATSMASPARPKLPFASSSDSPIATITSALAMRCGLPAT